MDIDCQHVDNGDGICTYCMQDLGRHASVQITPTITTNNKSLWKNGLDKLTFVSDEVKYRADEIYRLMNLSSCRKGRRDLVILYCVDQAMKEFNVHIPLQEIASAINSKSNKLGGIQSLETQQLLRNNNKSVIKISQPEDWLDLMVGKLGLEDTIAINNLKEFTVDIMLKVKQNKTFVNIPPQNMMASIIYYFLSLRSSEVVSVSQLCAKLGVPHSPINSIIKNMRNLR